MMNLIMRLSEQNSGRMGNPPARAEEIEKLKEVEIGAEHYVKDELSGEHHKPKCSICLEELEGKASQMPCGHLFNKECIGEWLSRHNQCPVCRYELPSADEEYERRKQASEGANQSECS